MKQLLVLITFILSFVYSYSSGINLVYQADTIDIKKWTKEDFLKEFNFTDKKYTYSDTAYALINLFFAKNKRGKAQTIIGGALLTGGIVAVATPSEPGDDQKGFGDLIKPVAEPAAIALGAIFTSSGIIKLGKYTKQKLYILLSNYKNDIPLPGNYRRKLKWKYFKYRIPPNPKL